MVQVTKSITVKRPRTDVYEFWGDLGNLPRFMLRLRTVRVDGSRSHWVAAADGHETIEWDAEIIDDRPGGHLSWQSRSGSDVHHVVSVAFRDAPADKGTEVDVQLQYDSVARNA